MLVLDDPFSAVDPATEAEILRNLRMLAQDRVILLISHRLVHFAQFDQVLWLENGTARSRRSCDDDGGESRLCPTG